MEEEVIENPASKNARKYIAPFLIVLVLGMIMIIIMRYFKTVISFNTVNGKESIISHKRRRLQVSGETVSKNPSSRSYKEFGVKYRTIDWSKDVSGKLQCLQNGRGGLYFYHTRKSAGTTLRELISFSSLAWRVKHFETEGVAFDRRLLSYKELLTVIVLRHPIERIVSLYWYEHVEWFHNIVRKPANCKSMKEWVASWTDGSEWKNTFLEKNPGALYVEIDNYYTKMLSTWKYPDLVTKTHLDEAKEAVERFDILLLQETLMNEKTQAALRQIFPRLYWDVISTQYDRRVKLKGDLQLKNRLQDLLAPDEEGIMKELMRVNEFDLELYVHAQALVQERLQLYSEVASAARKRAPLNPRNFSEVCGPLAGIDVTSKVSPIFQLNLPQFITKGLGVHRPPGHKGPF